jgi:hypothetical protein
MSPVAIPGSVPGVFDEKFFVLHPIVSRTKHNKTNYNIFIALSLII